MTKDEYETKCEEFEVKLQKYVKEISKLHFFTEPKCFYTAANIFKKAEELFSDGLYEELYWLAKQRDEIEPPEEELDIIKDSDGFKAGE